MHEPLRHREGTSPDINRQEEHDGLPMLSTARQQPLPDSRQIKTPFMLLPHSLPLEELSVVTPQSQFFIPWRNVHAALCSGQH
jgi:hypothetical protein